MSANYELSGNGVTRRVRYFDGQFLRDQDFIDDQKYHLDRQRRSLRFLQVSGVCDGLDLIVSEDKARVLVKSGTALDRQGRLIVLGENREVSINVGETRNVYISYGESEAEISQIGNDKDSNGQGIKGATRWEEAPLIEVLPESDTSSSDCIYLGRVLRSVSGITVDKANRKYSGVYLPGSEDGKTGASLRSGGHENPKQAILDGSLKVQENAAIAGSLSVTSTSTLSDKVGIGGAPSTGTEKLKVTGDVAIAGSLSVTGASNNLTVEGTSTLTSNVRIGGAPSTGTEKLKVTGDVAIAGSLSVTGASNNLTVEGTSTLTSNVRIGGAPSTGTEKLKVTGDVAIAGTLSITGTNGNLTVSGTSALNGDTTIADTLSVISVRGRDNYAIEVTGSSSQVATPTSLTIKKWPYFYTKWNGHQYRYFKPRRKP
jgi:hypothetical protein